ncbi:HAD family hydrolase [Peptoniphilus equinus]|uniref:HAD family hydrolase n=1 Tax=Peptoniphilus equinus TaxID=3016343 RepID=A0ABY7QTG5_9FIRM|nr:HAD family hydrolase [Peptoniphilus equinus]WBW50022.1 HAD family hydrolase [Peptoniphilus equinus]
MKRGIFFDKDGTLLKLQETWLHAMAHFIDHDLSEWLNDGDIADCSAAIGLVDGQILPNSIIASGTLMDIANDMYRHTDMDAQTFYTRVKASVTSYLAEHIHEVTPMDGAETVLKALKEKGVAVAVLTNDETDIAEMMLEHTGLLSYVDLVLGADQTKAKPDPDMLIAALKALELSREDVVYVGDSLVDYDFSKNLVDFVGIGGTFPKSVTVIEHLDELLSGTWFQN